VEAAINKRLLEIIENMVRILEEWVQDPSLDGISFDEWYSDVTGINLDPDTEAEEINIKVGEGNGKQSNYRWEIG